MIKIKFNIISRQHMYDLDELILTFYKSNVDDVIGFMLPVEYYSCRNVEIPIETETQVNRIIDSLIKMKETYDTYYGYMSISWSIQPLLF